MANTTDDQNHRARVLHRSEHDTHRLTEILGRSRASPDDTAIADILNIAHRMMGTAQSLQLHEVAEAAERLCTLCRNSTGRRHELPSRMPQFTAQIEQLEASLAAARDAVPRDNS